MHPFGVQVCPTCGRASKLKATLTYHAFMAFAGGVIFAAGYAAYLATDAAIGLLAGAALLAALIVWDRGNDESRTLEPLEKDTS